jgi:hypothetical protein
MLFLNRLPRLHHPLLKNRRFALATHDKFFVVIEAADPKYRETETRKLLEDAGSRTSKWWRNNALFPARFPGGGAGVVSVAGFRGSLSRRPPIELFCDMDRQPKLRPNTITHGKNLMGPTARTSRWPIAGPSSPMCGPCSAATWPPWTTCRHRHGPP